MSLVEPQHLRALHPVHLACRRSARRRARRRVDVAVQDVPGAVAVDPVAQALEADVRGSSGSSLTPAGGQWAISTSARRELAARACSPGAACTGAGPPRP